jgi:hypothetical protein
MRTSKSTLLVLFCAVLLLTAVELRASDPVGIYALVEKVVLEPNDSSPQKIQVWGAFAFADDQNGDGYVVPQRGYLYFTLLQGKEEICKKEWADLKAVAGTSQGVGFGRRYQPKGRVRKANEKPESPDTYPIGFGMQKMGSMHNQPDVIAQLKRALQSH